MSSQPRSQATSDTDGSRDANAAADERVKARRHDGIRQAALDAIALAGQLQTATAELITTSASHAWTS
jgi:hypothetical protein